MSSIQDIEKSLRQIAAQNPRTALRNLGRVMKSTRPYGAFGEPLNPGMIAEDCEEPFEVSPEMEARVKALAPIVHANDQLQEVNTAIGLIMQLDLTDPEWRRLSLCRVANRLRSVADAFETAASPKA